MIDPEKPKLDKKDLASYYSRRTFLVIMVAHLAVFLFTTFMAYTSMPGFSKFLPLQTLSVFAMHSLYVHL